MQVVSVYSYIELPQITAYALGSEIHVLPVYKKNRISSLLCIFETTVHHANTGKQSNLLADVNISLHIGVCQITRLFNDANS